MLRVHLIYWKVKNKMIGTPRLQGKVGQVEECKEDPSIVGKWTFAIFRVCECVGDYS